MNIGKRSGLVALALLLLFTTSCKKDNVDPVSPVGDTQYSSINSWVYGEMADAYFWSGSMPAQATLDPTANPADYFEKLIYKRATVDRFSGITDDVTALQKEFNGVSKIFGIQYQIAAPNQSASNVGLYLSYVVKGSPAELAGLKRGDIITKVDGQLLTTANYATLLRNSDTHSFTLGTLDGTTLVSDDLKTFSITKAEVNENPVGFSTIIDKSKYGKKIGYLVYTQFVPGTDASPKAYDDQLRKVFGEFKAQGVNELVLDLRFNGGGYISSAETLASLIGKNISASKVFYKEQWNENYTAILKKQNGANALDHNFLAEPNNIGSQLDRVFVLTSQGTASASELVINGLRPYMNLYTVGDHTYGKNLFGTLVSDEQKRWNWGIYVMLGQTANANNESDYGTASGIAANYQVDDTVIPYRSFGDDNETLFNKVLNVMGVPVGPNARLGVTAQVKPIASEFLKDNLQISDKRMIKEF
ncbi:S41 family peptidase [Persicitalea jodogahamensis]|uniref:Peptidase S41 n=1 Tax=Persicitalea jodogahamensis TaxID=402147 RepID=A0A8J3GAA5_9BACT|nr:S41 family peptidase [Persicitalea jodogahamensis]GHB79576.1 peptidase S41 [Persicitalea jodogahamensis]